MRNRALLLFLLLCFACKQEPVRRDAEVKETLQTIRGAIAAFRKDHARYPRSLNELVPNYLPRVPVDPATQSATTWRVTTESVVRPSEDFTGSTPKTETYVIDVQSGAGAPYSSY